MDLNALSKQKTAFVESFKESKNEFRDKSLPYKIKLLSFEGLKEGLTTFVVVFLISEIMISGGRYEKDPYLFAIILLAIILLQVYFAKKAKFSDWKFNLLRGIKVAVFYAIFDLVIIGLLLSKSLIYHLNFWGTYASYGVIIVFPVLYPKIRSFFRLPS